MGDILGTATSTLEAGINWGLGLPTDILIVVGGSVVLTIAFVAFGLRRALAFMLALEIGALIYRSFPYFGSLGGAESSLTANAALLLGMVLILTFFISRAVVAEFSQSRVYQFLQAFALGASTMALLLAFSYNVLSFESFYHFGPLIATLFAPDQFFFWWLLTPLVLIWPLSRSD